MYDSVIRRFTRNGKVKSDGLITTRDNYAHTIMLQMKAEGYLPLLDLESSWWVSYLPDEDLYEVRYADQGIYYGKEDINEWAGWLLGQLIPMTKKQSKALSKDSE